MSNPSAELLQDKEIYGAISANIPNEVAEALESRQNIYIRQKATLAECFECCTGCEMANKYRIEDANSKEYLFYAKEKSNCCLRTCCGSSAPFRIEFYDTKKKQLALEFKHPYRCTDARCCCPCGFFYHCGCVQEMDIYASNKKVGYVKEQYGTWCCSGKWSAFDHQGYEQLRITTNCCDFISCCCCRDIHFKMTDKDGQQIGRVSKKWVCSLCGASQQIDNFQVDFNHETTVDNKLLGMATAMLLKYVYFEDEIEQKAAKEAAKK